MLRNAPNDEGNNSGAGAISLENQTISGASIKNNTVVFDWEAFKRDFENACSYLRGRFVDVDKMPAGGYYYTKESVEKYLFDYYAKNQKLPTNAECCAYFTAALESIIAKYKDLATSKKRNFFKVKKV